MSMQSILSASLSLNRLSTMQSIHTQTQGRINVLNAEIKQDGGSNPFKEEQVENLEKQASDVMGNLMGELENVNDSMKPSEEEEKPDGAVEKEPDTDKVEISHRPEEGEKAVAKSDPVSYDAEGKTVKAEPSGKKVDAKA